MNPLYKFNDYKIFLASKSPRRKEIMKMLDIPFEIITISGIEEDYPDTMKAEKVPEYLALKKAEAYIKLLDDKSIVITADTIVICENRILGKPKDIEEAAGMLSFLSGKAHKVITGVSISSANKSVSFSVTSEVLFSELTKEEIEFYVKTYRPMDKAGAYGIQEWIGAVAVSAIKGSFYNVMGLPVHRLYDELKRF